VAAKEGAAQNRTSITNQPLGVGKVEMGFFAPLLGISFNTTGLSVSNNGLFSLSIIGLLKAAETSSKLLTANQSETHRYTTIDMASHRYPYDIALFLQDLYSYLTDIYQNYAYYCVLFISQHYAMKLWTTHERKAAQARAFAEQREYILPIRLDQTEIPGILPTLAYISWHNEPVESIAHIILEKLETDLGSLKRNISMRVVIAVIKDTERKL
jgi:hypothetical protein